MAIAVIRMDVISDDQALYAANGSDDIKEEKTELIVGTLHDVCSGWDVAFKVHARS
jgi:hypothetical protein